MKPTTFLLFLGLAAGLQTSLASAGVREFIRRVTGRGEETGRGHNPAREEARETPDPPAPPEFEGELQVGAAESRIGGTSPADGNEQRAGVPILGHAVPDHANAVGTAEREDLRDAPTGARAPLRRIHEPDFDGKADGRYAILGDPLGNRAGLHSSGAAFVEMSNGEKIAVDAENNVYYRDPRGNYVWLSTIGELLAAGNVHVDEALKQAIAERRASEARAARLASPKTNVDTAPIRESVPPPTSPRGKTPADDAAARVDRRSASIEPSPAYRDDTEAPIAKHGGTGYAATTRPQEAPRGERVHIRDADLKRRVAEIDDEMGRIRFEATGRGGTAGDRAARRLRLGLFVLVFFGAMAAFMAVDFLLYYGSNVSSSLNGFGVLAPELQIPIIVKSLQSIPAVIASGYIYHKMPRRLRTPYMIAVGMLALAAIALVGWNYGAQWAAEHAAAPAQLGNGITMNLPGMSASEPAAAAPSTAALGQAVPAWLQGVIAPLSALAAVHPAVTSIFFVVSASLGGFFAYLGTVSFLRLIGAGTLTKEDAHELRWLAGERAKLVDRIDIPHGRPPRRGWHFG